MKKIIFFTILTWSLISCNASSSTISSISSSSEIFSSSETLSSSEVASSIFEQSSSESSNDYEWTYLTEIEPKAVKNGYAKPTYNKNCIGDKFLLNGFKIENGISMHPGADSEASITYDISNLNYDTFISTIGKNDQQASCKVIFYVYVDNVLCYKSPYIKEAMMDFIKIDIDGAKELTIAVDNGGDAHSYDASTWGYPCLINKKDLKVSNVDPENLNYIAEQGKELDTSKLSAIVSYSPGTFKRVTKEALSIRDYDKNKLGKQIIKINYDDFSFEYMIYCCKQNEYYSIADKLKWINYKTYKNNPTIGKDIDDNTEFSIAGKVYADGIGLHPLSDEIPAHLTIALPNERDIRFHAILGKTRKALKNEVIYYVYGDSNLLYKSPFAVPGISFDIDISVAGISELKIVIDDGDDSIDFDCAGIGDGYIYKSYN